MKKLILGVVAIAAIPSMSMAQEAAAPAPWSNAYVNVSTSLEGTADWVVGSEVNLAGVGGYAQLVQVLPAAVKELLATLQTTMLSHSDPLPRWA